MDGRGWGCRFTMLGCGTLFIFAFFMAMMDFSKITIGKAQVKRQRDDVSFDLPLLHAAVMNYTFAHNGKLPPMDSAASFKKALFPSMVATEDTFTRSGDKVSYAPNPELSGKVLRTLKNPEKILLLSEPTPGLKATKPKDAPAPQFAIYLDGGVRSLNPETPPEPTVQ